ncbi:hypothetical protein MAR_000741, partial [Mya arenaria]
MSPYTGSGTSVGTVNATDEDSGTFGQFSYFMDTSSLPGNYFLMNSATGEITTVVDIPTACNCSSTSYTLPVTATDQGGRVATSLVTIYITESTTTTLAILGPFVTYKYLCSGPPLCRNPCRPRYQYSPRRIFTPYRPSPPQRPPPPPKPLQT